MNDYIKLIIFNIVMIYLSYKFKKNIIIFYVFLMLIMLSYEMMLKNKLIEGNYQEELFKSLDNLDYNRPTLELPIDKMSLILEKMLEKITGKEKLKKGKECKGEFVINKLTNKTCGDGFNEKVYKILDKGDGDCLHSELYKEKVPLRPCEYAEKCEKDLDCKSNKCKEGICDFELDCSETMLSGCGYDSCLALNDGLDKDLYYWYDGECNVNPCNENTYEECDEGGCEDLSYRFEYNKELKICEEIIDEQGEETRRLDSMEEQYDRYITEGGYDNVCKPNDFETCEVSPNLEPRYYCKEDFFVKENKGIDGDSNHCTEAPSWVVDLQKACSGNQQGCFEMCEIVSGQNRGGFSTCPMDDLSIRTITANDLCDQKCATNLVPYVQNCSTWLQSQPWKAAATGVNFAPNLIDFAENNCQ